MKNLLKSSIKKLTKKVKNYLENNLFFMIICSIFQGIGEMLVALTLLTLASALTLSLLSLMVYSKAVFIIVVGILSIFVLYMIIVSVILKMIYIKSVLVEKLECIKRVAFK